MIAISINSREFQEDFAGKLAVVKNPTAMLKAAGRELGNQLKRHFRQRDRTSANHLAPDRREHFWLQIAQSVQLPVQEGPLTISVTVSDPRLPQKVYGGTITAKNAKALTIPVAPDAYGRSARTFEAETGLKLFLIRSGTGAFGRALLATKENNAKGFTVEYLLTPSVDQDADPDALPEMGFLEEAILDRADPVLNNQLRADVRAAAQPGPGDN
jgi:hypothetical protein